jgi:hypothetical protein
LQLPFWSPLFLLKLIPGGTAMVATFTNKHGPQQEVPDFQGLAMVVVSQHIISLENVKLKLNLQLQLILITDMVVFMAVTAMDMDMVMAMDMDLDTPETT